MSNPQQPEIRRSERGEVVQGATVNRLGGPSDEEGDAGPVPEDNRPGHHPEVDQDKPQGPPPGTD